MKHFVVITADKYKGPKAKGFNQNIDTVLDECLKNECLGMEAFMDIIM